MSDATPTETSTVPSNGWFETILLSSPDAIIAIDQNGRVIEWSPQAHRLFGWTREEACGELLGSLIIPPQYRDAHWIGLQRYRKTGEGRILNQRLELSALNRDGDEFPVEFSVTPTRIGEQLLFVGFLRRRQQLDKSDRSRQRAIESRLFQQATARWASADTFETALQDCVDIMCSIAGWPVGHALLPMGPGGTLQSAEIWHLADEEKFAPLRELARGQCFAKGEGLPGRIWEAGETIWSAAIGEDPRFDRSQLAELGLSGVFGYPVIVDGDAVAVLEFLTAEEVAPDPQLLMQVGSLSAHLGRMMEQHRWEQERLRLAAIVDSSYDAIIGKDAHGRIISWNKGAEQVYGYSAEEAVGQTIQIILPEGILEEEPEIQQAVRTGRRLLMFDVERRRKDGRLIPVSITVSPIHDSSGRVVGTSTIERDVSDRRRREQELEQAKEQAVGANRAKTEFLANISHELRTPMNAIIGMLDLSLGEDLDPVVADYLETARDSADTLLYLLNDLLDFSRMEAGRFELEDEPFSLRETVEGAMKTMSLRAHETGLEFAGRIGSDVPDQLRGDGHRLRQVLLNLISNAIKFTEQGEVTVQVSVRQRSAEVVVLAFEVQDTGIGIALADQQGIFQPFTQIDASTTRQQTGTGLGLAICRELVQKMGGFLSLESQLGIGSRFWFELRLPVLANTTAQAALVPDFTGLPVLVVDDNQTNRTILEESLTGWGMRPTVIDNGSAALEELRRADSEGHGYELVIVDALMPNMDGFTLIERINEEGLSDTASVLMLSSADRQSFKDRCAELDVDAYLEKPITQSDMLDALMTALEGGPAVREVIERMQQTKRPLNILVAEDTPANQKVIRAILEKRGHRVEIAHNGREAIERNRQHDYDLILMDVQMPTMDGLQATEAIRGLANDVKGKIPIVAMTAHARREDRLRCLQAGMNAYIAKPIDARQLLELIESTRQRAQRRLARADTSREQSVPASTRMETLPASSTALPDSESPQRQESLINRQRALARMGGSEELLGDMIQFFLDDSPLLLRAAAAAIQQQDAEELMRAAHSLKGLAATFDATHATSAATKLEEVGRTNRLNDAPEALVQLQTAIGELTAELEREG